ncbi:hypothetical protein PIB30_075151, partial [Stylosanthes scabra]|nr:hypothetical protein [Stylosanthes scabra]
RTKAEGSGGREQMENKRMVGSKSGGCGLWGRRRRRSCSNGKCGGAVAKWRLKLELLWLSARTRVLDWRRRRVMGGKDLTVAENASQWCLMKKGMEEC